VNVRAVLFDWDGTLVDTAESSFRCYVKLFGSFGIPFDHAAYERTYCPDWYQTYVAIGLPKERWREADARWLELFAEEPAQLLPGARAALVRVRSSGLPMGLVTSGEHERVALELRKLDVAEFFPVLVGGGDTRMKKPDPEALLLALSHLEVAAADAAYIGDSPEDVEMARRAGSLSVGIPGGFPNREALRASAPSLLAEDLASALDALLA
jgi:HAD superfamily hydrolase (TIGR01549 family)